MCTSLEQCRLCGHGRGLNIVVANAVVVSSRSSTNIVVVNAELYAHRIRCSNNLKQRFEVTSTSFTQGILLSSAGRLLVALNIPV